jgi:hypothetical protein
MRSVSGLLRGGPEGARNDIIRRNADSAEMMKAMKLIGLAVAGLSVLIGVSVASAQTPWEQPAAELAEQIAGVLGPAQAHLTIRNISSISTDEIPAIRKLLEQDLKSHGVTMAGAESANGIRITLSESTRERLWVAEIVEGTETRVAMVHVEPGAIGKMQTTEGLELRRQMIFHSHVVLLAIQDVDGQLVALEPEQIVIYRREGADWKELKRANVGQKHPLPRDPRGMLVTSTNGHGFEAWLAGSRCTGNNIDNDWTVRCHDSDDPWPLLRDGTPALNAFYNAARNYFTGVVSPSVAANLPPFYSLGLVPRATGRLALLVSGLDGKVQLTDGSTLKTVTGTRDWGSDFTVLHSGCGSQMQIVTSSSGEAATDSLRAFELPALEAVPASAPLAMNGTVTAIFGEDENKSMLAIVQTAANEYEVDRVTASCN